jgi:hypothetical protein
MIDRHGRAMTMRNVLRSDGGRRFFWDRPPRRGNAGSSKSLEEAGHKRELLVKALRRSGSTAASSLADVLGVCSLRRPCLSGGCPLCMCAAQRMFVYACRNLFEHHKRHMVAVNIISARRAIPYGGLHRYDLFQGIETRLIRALSAAGTPAVGGFDLSANEHETNAFEPHWMPHAWILAPGRRMRRVAEDLREWFAVTDIVPRPMRMTSFDGAPVGFAYALKPDFYRRISLEPRWLLDDSRSTFSTRKKPIWGAQRVELALALDRAGLDARLFLMGYELVEIRGEVEIVQSSLAQRDANGLGKNVERREIVECRSLAKRHKRSGGGSR